MTFRFSNDLISNKMREEMYIKHLREVERINNREAEALKKKIKHSKSIEELHHHNKDHVFKFKMTEYLDSLSRQNALMKNKIKSIDCQKDIKSSRYQSSRYESERKSPTESKSPGNSPGNSQVKSPGNSQVKSPEKKKESFHYWFRRKRQDQIEKQNATLLKAIASTKSTLLPILSKNKAKSHNISVKKSRTSDFQAHHKREQ